MVAQTGRGGPVLDATAPSELRHRSPVRIQETLEDGDSNLG